MKKPKKVDVHLARVVLAELVKAEAGLRRTRLEKLTLMKCGTRATFDSIFNFLKTNGYAVKASSKRTAPYIITEKGKLFLEALECE